MDQDYIKQLSSSEKKYLSDFMEEYYGANLDYQNLENNRFHKTEKEKKDCTDRNNARNRDAFSIKRATQHLIYDNGLPIHSEEDELPDADVEDAIISYLDSKKTTND